MTVGYQNHQSQNHQTQNHHTHKNQTKKNDEKKNKEKKKSMFAWLDKIIIFKKTNSEKKEDKNK